MATKATTKPKVPRKPLEPVQLKENRVQGHRIGNQIPTINVIPAHTDTSRGDKAIEFLNLVGIKLDPWQEHILRASLNMDDKRGKWAATEVGLIVPRQCGKGLPPATTVLTANRGWTTIGELAVGDEVFHPDGTAVRVTHKFPDRYLDCYRVTTTDGRSVVVDGDHLWTVTEVRTGKVVTIPTRDMRPRLPGGACRYRLPRQYWLSGLEKRELPVDPYLFGAWLGDGHSYGAQLTTSYEDAAHWLGQLELAGYEASLTHNRDRAPTINIRGMSSRLRALGVLGDKRIPTEYLLADEFQREALLQGLCDTDGHCGADNGRVEFCTTKAHLAQDVAFLARSLGWRVTVATGRATLNGRDCGTKYRVMWTPKVGDPFTPFRLPRKLNRIQPPVGADTRRFAVSISAVERVESQATQCIKVEREDGLFLVGRELIPTHNTVIAELRELVGLFLFGEQLQIHSAQLFSTAKESFLRQWARIKACPDLDDMVYKYRTGNDNVSIELKNGSRLLYQARGNDPSRGFSADLVVYDEAYGLTAEVIAASMMTLSARPNPQLWYCSSTGMEDSEFLLKVRERGLDRAPRLAFFEFSATPGCDPKDREEWYKAIPALGIRLTEDFIETEGEALEWGKQFKRERLGLWADTSLRDVIPLEEWNECGDANSEIVGDDLIAAVDVSPYRDRASVAMCGISANGRRQVEAIHSATGTDWIVDYVRKLLMSSNPPARVVIQGGGAAGSFIAPLMTAGAEVIVLGQNDIARATGEFYDAVMNRTLVHLNDPLLERALQNSTRYSIGSKEGGEESPGWGFARKDTNGSDITPIVACCYAHYGLSKFYAEQTKEQATAPKLGPLRGGRIW